MKKFVTCMFVAVVFLACEPKKNGEENEAETSTAQSTPENETENQLSEEQKGDGWRLLFNGENMDGWRTFKNEENDSWEVVNGTLHCKSTEEAEKRADILTVDQYENFELAFEWKIAPGDNSGVIYRATEEFNRPYLSGPEYQLIDDKGWSGDLSPTQTTGSNYDMHAAPEDKPINPPGEWNSSRIVVNGNHVEHWLNGTKVIEYELHSPEWQKLKEGSKWKDAEGYGAANKGHIDLQDHGGEVWFKNVMIKTL